MENKNILTAVLILIIGVLFGMLIGGSNTGVSGQDATVVRSSGGKSAKTVTSAPTTSIASTITATSSSCEDNISLGIANAWPGIDFTLQPGMEQKIDWDFRNCGFGIQNFYAYAAQPRPAPGEFQQSLPTNTGIIMTMKNLTTGEVSQGNPGDLAKYLQYADHSLIEASLSLPASGSKSILVEVTTTMAMGGPTVR